MQRNYDASHVMQQNVSVCTPEVPPDLMVLPVTKRIPTLPGSAVPTKTPKRIFELFFNHQRVSIAYAFVVKKMRSFDKNHPSNRADGPSQTLVGLLSYYCRSETDNVRLFEDAISPKEAIDANAAKEPAISENGMMLAGGGTGFIGSNFEFDWLAQSDEAVVRFDELNRIPSGTRQRIQCV